MSHRHSAPPPKEETQGTVPPGCVGVLYALGAEAALAMVCLSIISLSDHVPSLESTLEAFGFATMTLWLGVIASPVVAFAAFLRGRTRAQRANLEALEADLEITSPSRRVSPSG